MILFGPSGNSNSFYADGNKKSEQAFEWLAKKGLNAYEYSFGRGINIGEEKARVMRAESEKYGVKISVHAPYYINFSNQSDDMIEKSVSYVLNSAVKVRQLGGDRIVFHPASVGKMTREQAFELCKKNFDKLLTAIHAANMQDLRFCPETMGKINQIGDEREIATLCAMDDCLIPTVDFGHLNARTLGGLKTTDDFRRVIDNMMAICGEDKVRKMHVHFSKIEYSAGGEVRHLTFDDDLFGPDFVPLARVIKEYDLSPVVICESDGTQAEDALKMKNIFYNI